MRLLIYGMQSSGASTLAMLLAQRPDSCAFIDIWVMYVAPALPGNTGENIVAKVVVSTAYSLALHQERFRPDRTLLFLRHPVVNYRSLAAKAYRHHCGFMEEKFMLLDEVFRDRSAYNAILYYEDLMFDPLGTLRAISHLGWHCEPTYLDFARRPNEMRARNEQQYSFLQERERLIYGTGNYHGEGIAPTEAKLTAAGDDCPVSTWCPAVADHYRQLMRLRQDKWQVAAAENK
jgi:hypothetical protein